MVALLSRNGQRSGTLGAIVALVVTALFVFALARSDSVRLHGSGTAAPNGVYPGTAPDPQIRDSMGTWVHGDGDRGVVTSDAFRAPPVLDVALAGGTARTDEHIYLERLDTHEELPIAPAAEAGERWIRVERAVPVTWWGRHVQLVAEDDGGGYRGWIGVANLRAPGLSEFVAMLGPASLLLVLAFISTLLVLPALSIAVSYVKPGDDRSGATTYVFTLFVMGAAAEALFFSYRTNATLGALFCGALLTIGAAFSGFVIGRPDRRAALARTDVLVPWGVSLVVGLLYALLLVQATPAGGNVVDSATNAWWHFPPDNILPDLLARQVLAGAPPHPFLADWLSSDRPPLQAGFDLIAMWIMPNPILDNVRYEGMALWLQCMSFGGLYVLARAIGFGRRRSLFAVACCVATGCVFINSIYTWPKLITVAFSAAAIAFAIEERSPIRLTTRFAIAGAVFSFGMLAHSGVVFTLPALLVGAVVRYRFEAIRALVAAGVAAIVVFAPWLIYQKFIDPPGDRLLKWHLAGQIAPDVTRSAARVIIDAYSSKTFAEIVAMKVANVQSMFGGFTFSRPTEFFFVFSAVGILWVPLLWLLIAAGTPPERNARGLALIALGSLLVWCAMMWTATVIHVGSYLTLDLLLFPAALMAGRSRYLAAGVLLILLFDWTSNWLIGVVPATSLVVDASIVLVFVLGAALYAARRRSRELTLAT